MQEADMPDRVERTPFDPVLRIGALASELILASLVVMVNVEIVMRNVFSITIGIVDELMGYFLVAIVFLGLGQSIRQGALLRVDVFINALGNRVRWLLDRVFALIGVAIMSIYVFHLWNLVANSYRRGSVSGSAVAIPLWIPQSFMVVGSILAVVGFAVLVFRSTPQQQDGGQI